MDRLKVLRSRREAAKELWQNRTIGADLYVTVGMGTCGLAAGAEEAVEAIRQEAARRGLNAEIGRVGCVGMCSYEPMIELQAHDKGRMNYGQATADNIPEIFAAYYRGRALGERRRSW